MKLNIFVSFILCCCFQILRIQATDLQALKEERELIRLAKVKLHGEPLRFNFGQAAIRNIAFSPDAKHLAVSDDRAVIIYDLAAEKAKRLDKEVEQMRQEVVLKVSQDS